MQVDEPPFAFGDQIEVPVVHLRFEVRRCERVFPAEHAEARDVADRHHDDGPAHLAGLERPLESHGDQRRVNLVTVASRHHPHGRPGLATNDRVRNIDRGSARHLAEPERAGPTRRCGIGEQAVQPDQGHERER
jgi:hypothetical protein